MKKIMAVIVTLVVLAVIVVCSQGCSQQNVGQVSDGANISRLFDLIEANKIEGKARFRSGDRVEAGYSQTLYIGVPSSSFEADFTFGKKAKDETTDSDPDSP